MAKASRHYKHNRPSGSSGHDRTSRGPEPCPKGISKERMKAISAPYNFVPLANWVYTPEWGLLVSQDHPFSDGLSGLIDYTLTATSPLLVGGKQSKATESAPGEVKPFQLPNGRYAVAGSSLKGMIRSVIEIAGFGRMRLVDDAHPGLRDITGKFVEQSYTSKVRNKVKTGFLRARTDGEQEIVPCRMARLSHRDLESFLNTAAPIFRTRLSVRGKYQEWSRLCRDRHLRTEELSFDHAGFDAGNPGRGSHMGFPVFTGQISDSTKPKGKYKDFVFFDTDEHHAIPVAEDVWRDFLHVHGNDQDDKSDMSWPGYWRKRFHQGERVPVFYLQDGEYLRIGLAYMPKLAGDYSIYDLIDKASPAHRQDPGRQHGYDLADLLFGAVNSKQQQDALRGRVSFETAVASGTPSVQQQTDTILNGPKPTYFPNYLNQQSDPAKGTLSGAQYATYIDTGGKPPQVRGFKRYPARPEAKVQALSGEQQDNNRVKVRLHTLQEAEFSGRIVFHNLKPAELGALLWALTWDGKAELRHGLGMGKSFGFGQVHFDIDSNSRVIPNNPQEQEYSLGTIPIRTLINAFKCEMEGAANIHGGWETSPQIANLLAMADPAAAETLPQGLQLRHMHLNAKCKQPDGKTGVNEFQWAKQRPPGPFVLADYAAATGWASRWHEQLHLRHEEAERQEAKRRAAEEAEAMARATENMPEDEAALYRLESDRPWNDNGQFVQAMAAYLEDKESLSPPAHKRLVGLIEQRLPGLLTNPHFKKGKKKNKPAFTANQIALAERVNALQPR